MRILLIIIMVTSFIPAQMASSAKSKLKSLVVPGWGEYSMGYEERSRAYFIREAVIWIMFIGSKRASSWYESDYKAFGELHANVDMAGKDYLFAVRMGHYDSFTEYNEVKAQQRKPGEIYNKGKGNEWQWDSIDNRISFDKMRINCVTYNKYARFAIGGLILHRLISLIDVIYLERLHPHISFRPQLSTNEENLQLKIVIDY